MLMDRRLVPKSYVSSNKWGGDTPLLEVVYKLTLVCMDVLRHHPTVTHAKIRPFIAGVLLIVLRKNLWNEQNTVFMRLIKIYRRFLSLKSANNEVKYWDVMGRKGYTQNGRGCLLQNGCVSLRLIVVTKIYYIRSIEVNFCSTACLVLIRSTSSQVSPTSVSLKSSNII